MNLLKAICLYLKNKKEINQLYGYSLKENLIGDETASWKQKLEYWLIN